MPSSLHFISGLPRAGSTLLAAILGQNPRFRTGITSPAGSLVEALLRNMSMSNETAIFISDAQREALLRAVFTTLYSEVAPGQVVFDTNRMWCAKLPLLATLFPQARVICCVRDVAKILNSVERLVRSNALQPSGIFNFEPGGTVYSRTEGLSAPAGLVGYAWAALREAFFSEQARGRLIALTYESLSSDPRRAMAALYEFLNEPPFPHDFDAIAFNAEEFDRRLGTPGLHRVARRVQPSDQAMVLPADLVLKHQNDAFWHDPACNPHRIPVI